MWYVHCKKRRLIKYVHIQQSSQYATINWATVLRQGRLSVLYVHVKAFC